MKRYLITIFEQYVNDFGFIQEGYNRLVVDEKKLEWYRANSYKTQCGCEYFSLKSEELIADHNVFDIVVGGQTYIGVEKYKLLKLELNNIHYTVIEEYEKPSSELYNSLANLHPLI